ncbi:Inositolphosphorylceramide synthase subunit Kei1-domain-containing protein [Coniella lustricola]|uniref:Inositolphosphorylceramide synthase subunit Kei1-domain-containing protein n=1 Tax=Coniella lustricola TaxID=2025994 RepID=A0A2T3ABS2_9PEZI|nr:Inositolphosphorylceramide synthase subunit Kei1-domain-containing protein [Coniella lustricola]
MTTSWTSWLRLPKPKTCLGLMSLQTGTEIITITLIINKATGLYGLLAILTGFAFNAAQLSMYLYSTVILVTLAFLLPHIRKQTPFNILSLAWVYIIDTALNAAYTTLFAVEWYIASAGNPTDDAPAQATDTAASMVLIVALMLIRLYLMLVVMSFTRQALRRYVAGAAQEKEATGDLFAAGTPEGEGWKGKLGRAMVFVGQDYWLGGSGDEEWAVKGRTRTPLAAAVDGEDE